MTRNRTNKKLIMIACLSPGNESVDYSLNTLYYANMLQGNKKKSAANNASTTSYPNGFYKSISPKREKPKKEAQKIVVEDFKEVDYESERARVPRYHNQQESSETRVTKKPGHQNYPQQPHPQQQQQPQQHKVFSENSPGSKRRNFDRTQGSNYKKKPVPAQTKNRVETRSKGRNRPAEGRKNTFESEKRTKIVSNCLDTGVSQENTEEYYGGPAPVKRSTFISPVKQGVRNVPGPEMGGYPTNAVAETFESLNHNQRSRKTRKRDQRETDQQSHARNRDVGEVREELNPMNFKMASEEIFFNK